MQMASTILRTVITLSLIRTELIPVGLLVEKTRNILRRYDMAIEIFKTVALPVSIGVRGLILDIVLCVFFLGLLHPKHETLDFAHE